jgi:SAM-dependent methyltransferase
MKADEIKFTVKKAYSDIAEGSSESTGNGCCCDKSYSIFSDDYSSLEGYNPDADLGLGCGIPTEFADIKEGDHVLDLGSGAGNDCFVARTIVGESGKITGIDFTDAMLEKANKNLEKTDFKNIEFIKGDIENLPFNDDCYDIVLSNCVLNLVPDKERAFSEIHRVLKTGAHFCVSDIVLEGEMPENIRNAASLYAGCVSGALQKNEYIDAIKKQGFKDVEIKSEKTLDIPNTLLLEHVSIEDLREFKRNRVNIYSITVTGKK